MASDRIASLEAERNGLSRRVNDLKAENARYAAGWESVKADRDEAWERAQRLEEALRVIAEGRGIPTEHLYTREALTDYAFGHFQRTARAALYPAPEEGR